MKPDLLNRIDTELGFHHHFGMTDPDGDIESLLRDCRAEIERLSKPYEPMTVCEIRDIRLNWLDTGYGVIALIKDVEAAVIKRAGLEINQ